MRGKRTSMVCIKMFYRKPRKSKPGFCDSKGNRVWTILVLASLSSRPRSAKNLFSIMQQDLTTLRSLCMTTKSSAYLMKCIAFLLDFLLSIGLPLGRNNFCFSAQSPITFSMPSRAMLLNNGEIIAPCGVPASVVSNMPSKILPDLSQASNCLQIFPLKPHSSNNLVWSILSKHFAISASKTNFSDC